MIKLMGVTRSGNNYSYSSKAYQSFIINQRAYRASMEQAVHLDGNNNTLKDKAKFSENTLIKYIISVLITENHEYLKSEDLQGDVIIAKLLNDNPSLGDKPSPSNKMTEFEDEAFSNYDENKLETFFKNTWEKATFEGILKTLRAINEGIAEKYRFDVVTEEIDKILDDLEDEDDNTWFKSVFGD